MEPWKPDHRGMWFILPPEDMPITQVTMLQATVGEAWASYGGDPNNPEQFWSFLVGNGMANVPRETSPDSPHEKMLDFLDENDRIIAEQGLDVPRETSEGES